ncbi:Histone-lysine N-methyltransferase ASHR3 [Heracleum sosnowskyi]|uniref:Histone-lysine N-methyltransferase ASHR3 n=1 Tax=Heracleum sosnowskyi TaxID=360622 RepID=A0AAD8JCH3_9APIA|nr:Histone-lysine N-methyltransferase ASHR3 [Heracleum sosnowskyi]
MVKPIEAENCSDVMPGPDECKNEDARVSEKCCGESSNGEKALNESSDGSDGIFPILPFKGIQKLVKCRLCRTFIYSKTQLTCSVRDCEAAYHLECAQESLGTSSSRKFKCPQHACYLCKERHQLLRCTKCELAWHAKCAAFPEHVTHLRNQTAKAICWRSHETKKELFFCLPVPDVTEEFDIDDTWKNTTVTEMEPPSYEHIRRNIYLVKKKVDDWGADIGCTKCTSVCSEACPCRVQYISCSKACRCSDMCTNRPFQKEKRIKVVKTEVCGWGIEAAESINKGDFIIEYVGEVISDAECKDRLSYLEYMGAKNFYMCKVQTDFTIDSTFKGNTARFLNHSCDPNCNLEKRQLDGETRLGIFASRTIQAGEPLTYDYRYDQFGPDQVKCQCGASNCQGYLGVKRKKAKVEELRNWDTKGRRKPNIRHRR